MLLELQNICKTYGTEQTTVYALRNVNFQVEEGEYIAIMGPSGSGKSTLMNILGCLDRADSGTYLFDGTDISAMNEKELSDLRLHKIGFVFQTFQLLPTDSAAENVALPLIYAGVPKAERQKRAEAALGRVGLAERTTFQPSQLSGGQKQRVAIARAMINNPRIILADEPTGALDQKSGRQVMDLFRQLNEEGTTVIMITHDAKIASHAKRVLHIIDGELSEGGDQDG